MRGDPTGPGIAGWDEVESQRQQTQGDELQPDEGKATATEGRSEAVAGAGRGRRPGRRPPVRRQARRRVAGGTAAARDPAGQDQRGQASRRATGAGPGNRGGKSAAEAKRAKPEDKDQYNFT